MSGGYWDYSQYFNDLEEAIPRLSAMVDLLRGIEHELDWGHAGDTCLDCARLRVIAALETFFSEASRNASTGLAILRDGYQNVCPKCQKQRAERDEEKRKRDEVQRAATKVKTGTDSSDDDTYVAWLRWAGDEKHRHLVICDSDSLGAFRVWRKNAGPSSGGPPIEPIAESEIELAEGEPDTLFGELNRVLQLGEQQLRKSND